MNKNRVTPTIVGEDRAFCAEFSRTNNIADSFANIREGQKAGHKASGASRNKRLLKIFAASSLAFFMGIGTLCGVLIAPMNSTHASTSNGETSQTLSAQEKQLAGEGLGLDPENDPVIFTTDYGLEIRSHNVGEKTAAVTDSGASITVSSTSWNYISAGGYNWIIIGSYSASSYTMTATIRASQDIYSGSMYENSDAGNAIYNAHDNGIVQLNTFTIPAFSNAKQGYNGEIPRGCALCLCASSITNINFQDLYSGVEVENNYIDSKLKAYIDNTIYGSTSALSSALQALPIIPQTLTTIHYQGATSTLNNAYLFPLAGVDNSESFYVGTYLDTSTKRDIDDRWWLRSGDPYYNFSSRARYVYSDGAINSIAIDHAYGVRPAFILQLYSA